MPWSILLVLAGVLLLLPTAYAAKIGAPWAPTRLLVVRKAFTEMNIGSGDVVVDLGAGDGKILLEAIRRGAKAIGYELSPIMWAVARLRGAKVFLRNFYTQFLPVNTTIIFAFLLPATMPRLKDFLLKQRLPQAKYLLVYAFPFKDVDPVTIVQAKNCAPLYVYDAKALTSKP